MAKTLKLTHQDDAFFDKAVEALSSTAGLPDDATYDEKFDVAEAELRAFIRMSVKTYELNQLRKTQDAELKQASIDMDAVLDAQADQLTITIE